MRLSAQLATEAHQFCKENIEHCRTEGDVESLFKLYCGMNGFPEIAYSPICAAGPNGSVLHYIKNDRPLKPTDSILCDMGVKVDGYSSDITSTFLCSKSVEPGSEFKSRLIDEVF